MSDEKNVYGRVGKARTEVKWPWIGRNENVREKKNEQGKNRSVRMSGWIRCTAGVQQGRCEKFLHRVPET